MPDSRLLRLLSLFAVASLVALGGCAGQDAAPSGDGGGEHVVERSTEGNTTTVRNVSGSVWGGNATLAVELEIGVPEGADEYMLAAPFPLFGTEEEIFVAESRDSFVRVYGYDGVHRRDFGTPGPGPGELGQILTLAVTPDDRVLLGHMSESGGVKLSIFTLEGEFLEEWALARMGAGPVAVRPDQIFHSADGMWAVIRDAGPIRPGELIEPRQGFQRIGPDGLEGEPWMIPESEYEPVTYTVDAGNFSYQSPVPFSASGAVATVTSKGDRVWGHPYEYRIHFEHPDGSRTIAERVAEPVPVRAEEADYRRRMTVASTRRQAPDFDWDGTGMPKTKPWFRSFVVDAAGRVWVSREGPAEPVEECTDPEDRQPGQPFVACWQSKSLVEVFDRDGNYLGGLDRPVGLQLFSPHIRGDVMIAGHQDDMGVWKVRVYRIVLPGETGAVTEVIR